MRLSRGGLPSEILKSGSSECHSGLDKACPVLDTGESNLFNLESRWRLPPILHAKKRLFSGVPLVKILS
ncbi:MAG: hypothetical protein A2026_15025 [Deltaproteobacteria bacterium RBG_19FT_COMBO_46_12]|nr:MAG: hypothetical protein A2026_15025 [Deltaproteobacteria bacterium RBG_19FT_COMBO_46_12]